MGRDVAEPGVDARDSRHFDPEIVLVPVPAHEDTGKDGDEIDAPDRLVTKDDGPRAGTTMEVLGKLKPAFRPDGTVTAGNACPLNDGTAAVLVMSAEKAERLGLKTKARIIASTVAAIRPEIMGLGPIPAIQALLEQAGVKIDDVDVVEINEAFAAQIGPGDADRAAELGAARRSEAPARWAAPARFERRAVGRYAVSGGALDSHPPSASAMLSGAGLPTKYPCA